MAALAEIVSAMPHTLQIAVRAALAAPGVEKAAKVMNRRAGELRSAESAVLAAIGADPAGRAAFDDALMRQWRKDATETPLSGAKERVVIGSGPHAAVYAAMTAHRFLDSPQQRVIVIEQSDRAGGSFAAADSPAFWLNSRNRPGNSGTPGDDDLSLNYLPGFPVQLADITDAQYATNAEIAWMTRVALAKFAYVRLNERVDSWYVRSSLTGKISVKREGEPLGWSTRRLILATGLGRPKTINCASDRCMTAEQFMRRFDGPFPLQGMRRVAVIGAGDTGKAVVEALFGLGPQTPHRAASLDRLERVDWYGQRTFTRESWMSSQRSRYLGIGTLFPCEDPNRIQQQDSYERLVPMADMVADIVPTENGLLIGTRFYDHAVVCIGYDATAVTSDDGYGSEILTKQQVPYAARYGRQPVWSIGPAAALGPTSVELQQIPSLQTIAENNTALFRLAPRTAMLAATA